MSKVSDMLKPARASDTVGAGSPDLTIKMKKMYDSEASQSQMDGVSAPPWSEWVSSQGYGLDGKGLVFAKKR